MTIEEQEWARVALIATIAGQMYGVLLDGARHAGGWPSGISEHDARLSCVTNAKQIVELAEDATEHPTP